MSGDRAAEVVALVERLAGDLLPLSVLFAALELGLFDALDEARSVKALAERTGVTGDAAERICRALVHQGLLVRVEDRYFAPDGTRAVLGSRGPRSLAPLLRHQHRQLLPLMLRLADAARTGKPQHAAWPFAGAPLGEHPYDELGRHPRELETFLAAMDEASRGVGDAIARSGVLASVGRLLDLGGGGGGVARELLVALPNLTIVTIDMPGACDVARASSRDAGLEARHRCVPGDLRRDLGERGFDAVLLSAVLADWPEEERRGLLERAREALVPGGLLCVSETLLDDDRAGPPRAALLSCVMLAAMRGDQLSARDLERELTRAGFEGVQVLRGEPRDLVTARLAGAKG